MDRLPGDLNRFTASPASKDYKGKSLFFASVVGKDVEVQEVEIEAQVRNGPFLTLIFTPYHTPHGSIYSMQLDDPRIAFTEKRAVEILVESLEKKRSELSKELQWVGMDCGTAIEHLRSVNWSSDEKHT